MLIVDDDPSVLRLLEVTLEDHDFEVVTATNGAEALRREAEVHPDAIILDLQMPVMDGPTFLTELRARGCHTPVLVLSAYGAHAARSRLGAEASMEKPFDEEALAERLRTLIETG